MCGGDNGLLLLQNTLLLLTGPYNSQQKTKNFQAIWDKPNYSLMSMVPKREKIKNIQKKHFSRGLI